jgi:NET1-associated nuclear protein 1 (U3 small nucleolar RNA-associated protein 17)
LKRFITPSSISALALHPTEPAVAVGQLTGEIVLWYCLADLENTKPACSTLHWHAHAVGHIDFTADGIYMLSGGEEAVLVVWQLATWHKQFLPRLGSNIVSITVSPDQELYAVGFKDNTIKIISSVDMTIKQSVTGLKCASLPRSPLSSLKTQSLRSGLVVEPRNNLVVLSGSPGCLQFYNATEDKHVMEVETVPQNRISRTEEKEIELAEVTEVAFSADGAWMATIDVRKTSDGSGGSDPEVNLKIWSFDSASQSYIVNTRVASPHNGIITSLRFSSVLPSAVSTDSTAQPLLLVSSSLDGRFKTWQLNVPTNTPDRGVQVDAYWTLRSQGFYRDLPIRDVGFSSDSSILAVAAGPLMTLWDPWTNAMRGTLTYQPSNENIISASFVDADGQSGQPFLVTLTQTHVNVWNLLTGTVWWSCVIATTEEGSMGKLVVTDKESGVFLVAVMENSVPEDSGADVTDEEEEKTAEGEGDAADADAKQEKSKTAKKPRRYLVDAGNQKSTRLMLFTPQSPNPIASYRVDGTVSGISFLPSAVCPASVAKDASARLLILSSNYELQVLGSWGDYLSAVETAAVEAATAASKRDAKKAKGMFSSVYGSLAVKAVATKTEAQQVATATKAIAESAVNAMNGDAAFASYGSTNARSAKQAFMNAPSHLLPPPTKLVKPFLEGMLEKRAKPLSQEPPRKLRWTKDSTSTTAADEEDQKEEAPMDATVTAEDDVSRPARDFSFLIDVFNQLIVSGKFTSSRVVTSKGV